MRDVAASDAFESSKQRMAYALVSADGKDPAFVASLTGTTVEQVHEWVAAGQALRDEQRPDLASAPPEREELAKLSHDQRVAKFREDYKSEISPQRAAENAAFFAQEMNDRNQLASKRRKQ